jgi:MFS family permease
VPFVTFRGLPRVFWYLWFGTLVNRTGAFMFTFLPIYLKQERGLSLPQVGLLGMLEGVGMLAAGPVGGFLADRFGRRRSLALAVVLGAAAMLNMGMARSYGHLALAALLLGFCGEMYRPVTQAMIADIVPEPDRARAYGLNYWGVNLGFALAAVIGGLVSTFGFTPLFVADAVTTLVFGILVYRSVPETRRPSARPMAGGEWLMPYRDGVFMAFNLLALIVAMVFIQSGSTLPIAMSEKGFTTRDFGFIIAINGALIVLLQPLATGLVRRFRRAQVLAVSAVVVGIGFGINAIAQTPAMYALSVVVWTLGEIFLLPVNPSVVADLSPADLRGSYQGAFLMSWAGARILAPLVGMSLLAQYGGTTLWMACLGACLLTAVGHLAIAGPRRRRLAALAGATAAID